MHTAVIITIIICGTILSIFLLSFIFALVSHKRKKQKAKETEIKLNEFAEKLRESLESIQ